MIWIFHNDVIKIYRYVQSHKTFHNDKIHQVYKPLKKLRKYVCEGP